MTESVAAAAVPGWTERHAALKEACREADRHFRAADKEAIYWQSWHRRITIACVVAGAFLLVLGIVQLPLSALTPPTILAEPAPRASENLTHVPRKAADNSPSWPLIWLEAICTVIAAGAVILGRFRGQHENWLYWRYRAERFRSVRFRVMIDPCLWRGSAPTSSDWSSRLRHEVGEIEQISRRDLPQAAEQEAEPSIPTSADCAEVDPELLKQLTGNYLEDRLDVQTRYFKNYIEKQERNLLDNPTLLPGVFFVSVALVVIHLIVEVLEKFDVPKAERLDWLQRRGGWLLLASAVIPTVWTAFRTWRSANEEARNALRSRAKLSLLNRWSVALERALIDDKPDAFRIFTTLALSESLLHNELQEWLRLMLDAEWYG